MGARLPYNPRFRAELESEVRRCRRDLDIKPSSKRLFPMARQVALEDGTWLNLVDVYEIAVDGETGRDIGRPVLLNDVWLFSVAEAMQWGLDYVTTRRSTFTYRGLRADLIGGALPPAPPADVRVRHRLGAQVIEESPAQVAARFAPLGKAE